MLRSRLLSVVIDVLFLLPVCDRSQPVLHGRGVRFWIYVTVSMALETIKYPRYMSLTIICVVASGAVNLKILRRGVRGVLCHTAPRTKTLGNNIQFVITCKFQTKIRGATTADGAAYVLIVLCPEVEEGCFAVATTHLRANRETSESGVRSWTVLQ